ncbi:MAG: glycosyltransferase family 2 protein [Microbacterium sp.]
MTEQMIDLTIVVPTFNEKPNIARLVERLIAATDGLAREILFVDDSTDDTPQEVLRVAGTVPVPVRLLHRDVSVGGLAGAVIAGFRAASSDICVVMDGDLQHPPEDVPTLYEKYRSGDYDVVVASRYVRGGSSAGLSDVLRTIVSRTSTGLTKAMFPWRMRGCSDPMTGFFLVDRRTIDLDALQPRGFKILVEILARQSHSVAEIPFTFADRFAGRSKASLAQGIRFLTQLAALRFGKMSIFAVIGALGAIANIAIVWLLTDVFDVNYIVAAIIAAETTMIANFLLQEHFVFRDMLGEASGGWSRFAKSFAFNNGEAVIRIPVMALMVGTWHISSVIATAITLFVAFIARYAFHALVVYKPRTPEPTLEEVVEDERAADA